MNYQCLNVVIVIINDSIFFLVYLHGIYLRSAFGSGVCSVAVTFVTVCILKLENNISWNKVVFHIFYLFLLVEHRIMVG